MSSSTTIGSIIDFPFEAGILIDVLVSGHFLVLHKDHVRLFEYASLYGDVTVGINGDYYNRVKYGDKAIPAHDRAYVLASCKYVNKVIIFEEETPTELIKRLVPRYYIKGPDYRFSLLPEQEVCNKLGVSVLYRPGEYSYSSSAITGNKKSLLLSGVPM
jgi:bifunctional ADP-heptose synthase (sugar kinase/adenylyltransferase)